MTKEREFLDDYMASIEIIVKPAMTRKNYSQECEKLRQELYTKLSEVVITTTNEFLEKNGSKCRITNVAADVFFQGPIFSSGDE